MWLRRIIFFVTIISAVNDVDDMQLLLPNFLFEVYYEYMQIYQMVANI